jgi:hypothetical protein
MRRLSLLFLSLFALALLLPPKIAHGEDTECTITNYDSVYTLDAVKFTVQEKITVDCGTLEDKHGIFRTIQTGVDKPVAHDTPVKLTSITDENGKAYKYEETKDGRSVTWKIGDADTKITGVHQYWINFTVNKVVGTAANNQSEIYWDFLGTFWKMPIDAFTAKIIFPKQVTEYNAAASLFDGVSGSTTNKLSNFQWFDGGEGRRALVIKSNGKMAPGEGITGAITFPSELIPPYQPTFREKNGIYLWFLLPIFSLIIGFYFWFRFGRDPKVKKPEMVQYQPPKGLLPLELGLVKSMGTMSNSYVTATIVDLAVRRYLKITESKEKQLFGSHSDWILTLEKEDISSLKPYERTILNKLFDKIKVGATTSLDDQKNSFYTVLKQVKDEGKTRLNELKVFDKLPLRALGLEILVYLIVLALGGIFYATKTFGETWQPIVSVVATVLVGLIFASLMRRRTPEGADLLWQIEGFEMYLGRAEKYRMEFYEKEGIFEKYLPYAVALGLTKEWLKRMHDVYLAQGRNMTVWPWYVASPGAFNSFNNFSDSIDSMISSFGTTVGSSPSSSSSGGGGFSGGGGGGGGGGSW